MLVVETIARIRREYFVKGVGGDEKPRLDGDFSDIGHRGAVAAWFAGGSWLGAAVGK